MKSFADRIIFCARALKNYPIKPYLTSTMDTDDFNLEAEIFEADFRDKMIVIGCGYNLIMQVPFSKINSMENRVIN